MEKKPSAHRLHYTSRPLVVRYGKENGDDANAKRRASKFFGIFVESVRAVMRAYK